MSRLPNILPFAFLLATDLSGQGSPAFDVASVKVSQQIVGKDARQGLSIGAGKLAGRNVPLKELMVEAYHVQPFQVAGGPGWLDDAEYDIDARAGNGVGREQLRLMLRNLLIERFHLAVHHETRDLRVYALVVDKRGSKLKPAAGEEVSRDPRSFRGDMAQFAAMLSVQLSIPPIDDPTRPSRATGPPVPVIDKTGLEGRYDIRVDIRPELGGDMFGMWQRILQDQLGLRLESQRAPVDVVVVDRAERIPAAN